MRRRKDEFTSPSSATGSGGSSLLDDNAFAPELFAELREREFEPAVRVPGGSGRAAAVGARRRRRGDGAFGGAGADVAGGGPHAAGGSADPAVGAGAVSGVGAGRGAGVGGGGADG